MGMFTISPMPALSYFKQHDICIMTLSMITFSITIKYAILSLMTPTVVMLSVTIKSIMLSVVMLRVFMLNAVMLNVVAPYFNRSTFAGKASSLPLEWSPK